jgi:hypothetical protein
VFGGERVPVPVSACEPGSGAAPAASHRPSSSATAPIAANVLTVALNASH